jgi:hypothetical protein
MNHKFGERYIDIALAIDNDRYFILLYLVSEEEYQRYFLKISFSMPRLLRGARVPYMPLYRIVSHPIKSPRIVDHIARRIVGTRPNWQRFKFSLLPSSPALPFPSSAVPSPVLHTACVQDASIIDISRSISRR